MTAERALRAKGRGLAIALIFFAVVVLLGMGIGVMSLSLHGGMAGVKGGARIAARAAADAGLTEALFAMNERIDRGCWDERNMPSATDKSLPYCDARFSYAVTGDARSGYTIESVGQSGRFTKRINGVLRLKGLFDYGILAKESIILKSKTLVDAYDSGNPGGSTSVQVDIATMSTDSAMIVLNDSTVDGEVLAGVDYYFISMAPPVLPNKGASIHAEGVTQTIGPADSGKYTGISLSQQAGVPGILEAGGGNVVLEVGGNVDIGEGCEIVVKQGASLVLFMGGDLVVGNSAGMTNETKIPANLMLVAATCNPNQVLELKAKGDFCGVVYAPCADAVVRAGSDVFGAFVCKDFEFQSGGTFFYDTSLKNVEIGGLGARFVIDRWRE